MRKLHFIFSAVMLSLILHTLVQAGSIPVSDNCAFIILRTSEGWWLRINSDDSGTYGFGVQPGSIEVRKDTFDFKQMYFDIEKNMAATRENIEERYIAVSFYAIGASSAQEYYLPQRRQWLAALFDNARSNALPPANVFEERARQRIENYWGMNPYLSHEESEPEM